jgi:hypothetical protein
MKLHKYWIRFNLKITDPHPIGTLMGCGVTAASKQDALKLVEERVFGSGPLPSIQSCIEDVDPRILDPNHVLPNMSDPSTRGIWFPLGYSAPVAGPGEESNDLNRSCKARL